MSVFPTSILLISVLFLGCEATREATHAADQKSSALPENPTKAPAVTPVAERNKVCMVNNQYMGREQLPVVVAGKTYFGCCPMCKQRLEQDATLRTAVDPLSGQSVDKAVATIGKTASGDIMYFENEQNLQRYAAR